MPPHPDFLKRAEKSDRGTELKASRGLHKMLGLEQGIKWTEKYKIHVETGATYIHTEARRHTTWMTSINPCNNSMM